MNKCDILYIQNNGGMHMKQISLRLDENMLQELKNVADTYRVNYADLIREGIEDVLTKRKDNVWYRVQKMIDNTPVMDPEEETEIMEEISKLTDEDLKIVESVTEKIESY